MKVRMLGALGIMTIAGTALLIGCGKQSDSDKGGVEKSDDSTDTAVDKTGEVIEKTGEAIKTSGQEIQD